VADIADPLLLEEGEGLLLLELFEGGDVGIVVPDVLAIEGIDE
jgi:hypothetical protein